MKTISLAISAFGIETALTDARTLGRRAFRDKYGFTSASPQTLILDDRHLDVPAILASAYAHSESDLHFSRTDFVDNPEAPSILARFEQKSFDATTLKDLVARTTPSVDIAPDGVTTRYWWVNQGNHFGETIAGHDLWAANERADGHRGHKDWRALEEMLPGDVVFHHANGALRELSRVTKAAIPAPRPTERGPNTGHDDGLLVAVAALVWDIEIDLPLLQSFIQPGQAPFNRGSRLGGTYAAEMEPELAAPLTTILAFGDHGEII